MSIFGSLGLPSLDSCVLLDVFDDVFSGRAGLEDGANTRLLQPWNVICRDDSTAENVNVLSPLFP